MKFTSLAVLLLFLSAIPTAYSELLVDPVADGGRANFSLINAQTQYKTGAGGLIKIERTMIAASMGMARAGGLSIFGSLAYIGNAKIVHTTDGTDGETGFAFAGGVMKKLSPSQSSFGLNIYSQFEYQQQKLLSVDSGSLELDGFEVSSGALLSSKISENVSVFGGVEFILASDLEFEAKVSGSDAVKTDAKRDDLFGIKFGASFLAGGYRLGSTVSLLDESGIAFSLSRSF